MTNEKVYFKEIVERLKPFKEVLYFEPLTEKEILEIEKEWGIKLKEIAREFLLNFGFTQDVVEELKMDKEDIKESLEWLNECGLTNYLPITTELEVEGDYIIAIKNDDKGDDYLYQIDLENKDKSKRIKKKKRTFTEIIDKAVSTINVSERCLNKKKSRVSSFSIETENYKELSFALKEAKIKQVSEWQDKYFPKNIFGTKIAKFELFDMVRIFFERDGEEYRFSLDEPILLGKEGSLILKIEKLLKKSKLEFEKTDCSIVETE